MTARELVDLVYFLCAENSSKEDLAALNQSLEDEQEQKATESQDERRAVILAMGGGVA